MLLAPYDNQEDRQRLQEIHFSTYSDTQWTPSPQLQDRLVRTMMNLGMTVRTLHNRSVFAFLRFPSAVLSGTVAGRQETSNGQRWDPNSELDQIWYKVKLAFDKKNGTDAVQTIEVSDSRCIWKRNLNASSLRN